jgi:hypothetical protein
MVLLRSIILINADSIYPDPRILYDPSLVKLVSTCQYYLAWDTNATLICDPLSDNVEEVPKIFVYEVRLSVHLDTVGLVSVSPRVRKTRVPGHAFNPD